MIKSMACPHVLDQPCCVPGLDHHSLNKQWWQLTVPRGLSKRRVLHGEHSAGHVTEAQKDLLDKLE